MSRTDVILRKWTARIRTDDAVEYVRYIETTGAVEYRTTPGNLGWQILLQDHGDGTSAVTTLSWWRTIDAIRAFAGDEVDRACYYPEDDRFLIDRPKYVEHHRVAGRSAGVSA